MRLQYFILRVLAMPLVGAIAVVQSSNDAPSAPALEWLLTYDVDFDLPATTGDGPTGQRVIWPVRSGKFTGPRMSGNLHSLGGDWALVNNGTTFLDVRYQFITSDDAVIYVHGSGVTTSTGALHGQLQFETGATKYYWMNRVIGIALGKASFGLNGTHITVPIFTLKGEQAWA